jgi:hypothetical protein
MNYDIIGDIHGHADALEQLLQKMGYVRKAGVYSHPEGRQVLFVGDFIDRGPKIRETLHIVRDMVEAGHAQAVMGNHEYNAVCFHTRHTDRSVGFFRKHSEREIHQHSETLRQFEDHQEEWVSFLEWFRFLPMHIDLPECRVVHAYWKTSHIEWLKANYRGLTPEFLSASTIKKSEAYCVVEDTLKGAEHTLPDNKFFLDKDGHKRKECRVKWWSIKRERYGEVYMECPPELHHEPLPAHVVIDDYQEEVPVFFGHYWLKEPVIMEHPRSYCLDYSVAKGGKLVAARLDDGKVEIVG